MITHETSLDNFTEQFDFVIKNYKSHEMNVNQFDNIIMGGLGGSGIGAVLAKNWFFDKCPVPIETVADYHLPKFASSKTLVILNSYSGNTEETLQLFEEANQLECSIIVLTGGGKLKELAIQNNLKIYDLKSGYQPRMTVGQGLGFISMIFGELLGNDYKPIIQGIRDYFEENRDRQKQSGVQIFNFFKNTIRKKFVIVADREYAPVAVRFSQQLQENSKLEGFVNVLPEANHNAIESYTDRLDTNFIMLYSNQNPRVAARFDFLISHLELDNNIILPMQIPEYSLQAIFDVIYRLDWVSILLAKELGSDLMNVPIIMNLKGFLSDLEVKKD
jgi:glucose/mannose-6-phosphate isomerase